MKVLSDDEINEIVQDIIKELDLRELVQLANMNETDVRIVQKAFETFLRRKIGLEDSEELPQIMEAIWQRVRETHRLRLVK